MSNANQPATLPPLPYDVVELEYGGHARPTRRYPDGRHGGILSPEEIAVWRHLEAAHAELTIARERVAELTAAAQPASDPPPGAAADAGPKGKRK